MGATHTPKRQFGSKQCLVSRGGLIEEFQPWHVPDFEEVVSRMVPLSLGINGPISTNMLLVGGFCNMGSVSRSLISRLVDFWGGGQGG